MDISHETDSKVLTISRHSEGRRAVLLLDGELDLSSSRQLVVEAQRVLAESTEVLEIDARHLTFVDSAGLSAILTIRSAAQDDGVRFELSSVTAPIDRTIEVAGLREVFLPPDQHASDP